MSHRCWNSLSVFRDVLCLPKGLTIYSSNKLNRYRMLHQEFNFSVRKPTLHQIQILFQSVVHAINTVITIPVNEILTISTRNSTIFFNQLQTSSLCGQGLHLNVIGPFANLNAFNTMIIVSLLVNFFVSSA